MNYIKEIIKANVCSFCETVHEYESLEKEEFKEGVKRYLNENDLNECFGVKIEFGHESVENVI